MKSPWKLLSQLTSRRKAPDVTHNPVERVPEHEAPKGETLRVQISVGKTLGSAFQLEKSPATDPFTMTAIPNSSHNAVLSIPPIADIEQPQPEVVDETNPSGVDINVLPGPIVPELELSSNPTKERAKVQKTEGSKVGARDSVAIDSKTFVEAVASSDTYLTEEPKSLDEEIKQLRNQLARKLHQQNEQLRRMLVRFDRS